MSKRIDFEFTKDWGLIKKGTVKRFDKAFASKLNAEGRGKIKAKPGPKAVKPQANKVEPKAKLKETK